MTAKESEAAAADENGNEKVQVPVPETAWAQRISQDLWSANLIQTADRPDQRKIRQDAVSLVNLAIRTPDPRSGFADHANAQSGFGAFDAFGAIGSEFDDLRIPQELRIGRRTQRHQRGSKKRPHPTLRWREQLQGLRFAFQGSLVQSVRAKLATRSQ